MKPKKKKQGTIDPVKTMHNLLEALGIQPLTETPAIVESWNKLQADLFPGLEPIHIGPPPKPQPQIHRYVHRLKSGLEIQVVVVNNVAHSTYFNRTLQQLTWDHEADIDEAQQYDRWLTLKAKVKTTEHTKMFYNGQPGPD